MSGGRLHPFHLASTCSFPRLGCLEHLNLSYCEHLSDLCLEWISSSSISSLDISGCNVQDRVSFRTLVYRPRKRPSIGNPGQRLQGLVSLKGVPLKKLVMAECRVTDAGIEVTPGVGVVLAGGRPWSLEREAAVRFCSNRFCSSLRRCCARTSESWS